MMSTEVSRQLRYYREHKEEIAVKRKQYYLEHREELLARNHEYYRLNREKRLAHDRDYYRNHREELLAKKKEYYYNNQKKRAAKATAWYRIPLSSECNSCGSTENLERHHPDYNKPLEIITLCRRCHARLHLGIKEAK